MIISVTGSGGFIGKWLVKRLIGEGHEVREWDRHIGREIADWELEGADFVVHLAAMADVRASMLEPELWYKNNVTTTTRIQRICNENKIPLVYASSSCIHAWWKSPYGTTKKINEETAFPGQVGLRFTTVYGEGARDSMFIGKLLRDEIKYATNHIRDFIHVSDVVEGIMLFINEGTEGRLPAYNMGTGKGNTVSHVAHEHGWLGEITDGDDCEASDNTADNSELLKLGWTPKIDVIKYVKFMKLGKVKHATNKTEFNMFDLDNFQDVLMPRHQKNGEGVLLAESDKNINPTKELVLKDLQKWDKLETLSTEDKWKGILVRREDGILDYDSSDSETLHEFLARSGVERNPAPLGRLGIRDKK